MTTPVRTVTKLPGEVVVGDVVWAPYDGAWMKVAAVEIDTTAHTYTFRDDDDNRATFFSTVYVLVNVGEFHSYAKRR